MKANKGEFSKYHAYAFDGVWVIAKVVEHILKQQADKSTDGLALHEDLFRGDRISLALNGTNFRGVTVSTCTIRCQLLRYLIHFQIHLQIHICMYKGFFIASTLQCIILFYSYNCNGKGPYRYPSEKKKKSGFKRLFIRQYDYFRM